MRKFSRHTMEIRFCSTEKPARLEVRFGCKCVLRARICVNARMEFHQHDKPENATWYTALYPRHAVMP